MDKAAKGGSAVAERRQEKRREMIPPRPRGFSMEESEVSAAKGEEQPLGVQLGEELCDAGEGVDGGCGELSEVSLGEETLKGF